MKKFKFNPTTALLVAGLAASAYATCYNYVPTQAICFRSGDQVDTIRWNSANRNVYATADWTQGFQNGVKGNLQAFWTNSGYSSFNTYPVSYCYGPAKFMDPAGNTDTVPYWENGIGSCGAGPAPPANPLNNSWGTWGAPAGSPCQ